MTPAEELEAAARSLRESTEGRHASAVSTVAALIRARASVADLLEAVALDPDDESLNERGSEQHSNCDRAFCAPAAALAVARVINGQS